MYNSIAKKFQFQLDTKSTKIYKEKGFVCYDTDSISFAIEVLENEYPKELGDAQVEVVYSYPNGESATPFKQEMDDGGILVDSDGLIDIQPKNNCLLPTDYLRIDINIYDQDEFITLQPFSFKILKSVESEIFEKSETIVKTMRSIDDKMNNLLIEMEELQNTLDAKELDIDEQIMEMSSDIREVIDGLNNGINASVEEMNGRINQLYGTTEQRFDEFIANSEERIDVFITDSIDEVNDLMDRINNVNIELDECFLRSTPLPPTEYNGNLLFTSDLILGTPFNLIGKTYMVNVTGSPYNSEVITTVLALMYFTLENGNVVVNYTTLANKSVQGKTITITPQFSNMATSIDASTVNFKLYIVSNLPIAYIENASCTISANTSFSNKL